MKSLTLFVSLVASLLMPGAFGQNSRIDILPTPHYLDRLEHELRVAQGDPIKIWKAHEGLTIARGVFAIDHPNLQFQDAQGESGANIILWDYAASPNPGLPLNFLDKQLLESSELRSQSYVVRSTGNSKIWVVGGGPIGVMYGAATVSQLLSAGDSGVTAAGVYIRDYPDFEFRASSSWLLHTEINRWAFDRGQGLDAYGRLVREKLDRAAKYKINVALIDGFGWDVTKRVAGYAPLMRDLNQYARQRGISLQYGGYGAAYDVAHRKGDYHGTVFFNRESYPDGKLYQCLAFPEHKGELDPRTMGSCRANEELNRLKGEEIAHFVDEVEPGFMYIHHEDCCVLEDFQKAWLGRCERCRKRWPNDSVTAPDGGAGALAHGYSSLINAVNSVRHADRNYDAGRDTQIVIVSPVYMPTTNSTEHWGPVLELWRTITRLLPPVKNVQICFRETLAQPGGGKRWIDLFNSMMQEDKLPFGAYLFSVGGSDNFLTDYPATAAPVMNAYFKGARTMYNSMGGSYHDVQEVMSAEYAWNVHSDGFYRYPHTEAKTEEVARWMYSPGTPAEIFGPGKLFERVCERLYGKAAAKYMEEFYKLAVWLPEREPKDTFASTPPDRALYYRGRTALYLKGTWNYVSAVPYYWNYLLMDAGTWQDSAGRYAEPGVEPQEIHRRLARRWKIGVELNEKGAQLVSSALRENPRPDAVEDLKFLQSLFQVHSLLLPALRDYHTVRSRPRAADNTKLLADALKNARGAGELAVKLFPDPADTNENELQSLRKYPFELAAAIAGLQKRLGGAK